MTRDEALAVVHRMMAAWPSPAMPETTARLWLEHLARQDATIVGPALDRLIGHQDRMPSIAQMQDACRRVRYHDTLTASTAQALTASTATKATPDIAAEHLATMRDTLNHAEVHPNLRARPKRATTDVDSEVF